MNDISEVLDHPQLSYRNFWSVLEHPELSASFTYPGKLFLPSEGRAEVRRRAPLIGEHNKEIYGDELGFSEKEVAGLRQDKVI